MDAAKCLEFVRELRSLNHVLDARLNEGLRPLGISCVQADALMALHELQPCTLKTLSAHLIAESGHPSRLISRMKKNGLVDVKPSAADGRAMLISLTDQGERLAMQSSQIRQGIINELDLDVQDIIDATKFLKTVAKQVSAQ
ncbi:winged helix DNA-binding protein [Bifidobacterium sp. ESL0682]|uniref:MarR family winged helix-turn-helix transcriptional regulator n=1 Tax=Bifidobacterium sp. ESL0682 TaxID=2983212 RepID=UPI0023F9B03B|nr:winged helix DNA-binding protein [Bifidobacterium sp. ESL0682]WEV41344.1 winged helix DNA-binding protein [Bifidobacterium sp. ESL0682]